MMDTYKQTQSLKAGNLTIEAVETVKETVIQYYGSSLHRNSIITFSASLMRLLSPLQKSLLDSKLVASVLLNNRFSKKSKDLMSPRMMAFRITDAIHASRTFL